jgi:hypothetical protein
MLPRDYSVRFSDSSAFIASSLQRFVGDFRPKLFQLRRCRLVRVPFGIIRSPWHFDQAPLSRATLIINQTELQKFS